MEIAPPLSTFSPSRVVFCLVIGAGPAALCLVARLLSLSADDRYNESELESFISPVPNHPLATRTAQKSLEEKQKKWAERAVSSNAILVIDEWIESSNTETEVQFPSAKTKERNRRLNNYRKSSPPTTISSSPTKVDYWLRAWHCAFSSLHIPFLRSLISWHLDPSDPDSLRRTIRDMASEGYQQQLLTQSVENEERILKHRIQSISRNSSSFSESNRIDLIKPSTIAFIRHAKDVAKFTHIEPQQAEVTSKKCQTTSTGSISIVSTSSQLLVPGKVTQINPIICPSTNSLLGYTIHLLDGELIIARHVICCIGNRQPRIPQSITLAFEKLATKQSKSAIAAAKSRCTHLMDIWSPSNPHPALSIELLLKKTLTTNENCAIGLRILIIGGGLSSAQLALHILTWKQPVPINVTLLCRSQWRVRPFDLSLEWMGRHKARKMAEWYAKDYEERLQIIREARGGGGSITPEVNEMIRNFCCPSAHQGRQCVIQTECEIIDIDWLEKEKNVDAEVEERSVGVNISGHWQIKWKRTFKISKLGNESDPQSKMEESDEFDHIFIASGCQPNLSTLGLFGVFLPKRFNTTNYQSHATPFLTSKEVGGFPVLDHNLCWQHDTQTGSNEDSESGNANSNISLQQSSASILLSSLASEHFSSSCLTPSISFSGAFAALQLGPAAFNLAGAQAASRIIADWLSIPLARFVENSENKEEEKLRRNTQTKTYRKFEERDNSIKSRSNYFSVLED